MSLANLTGDDVGAGRRFKVTGLDCQNEVRALKAAVGPLAGGEDKLSALLDELRRRSLANRALRRGSVALENIPADAANKFFHTITSLENELEILNDVLKVKKEAKIKYGKWYQTISAVTGLRKVYDNEDSWLRRFLNVLDKNHCEEAITEEEHFYYKNN